MKTVFLIVVLLAFAGVGTPAGAQVAASPTPRPTPPPGPLLNKAPDLAAWTIVSQRVPADARTTEAKSASGKPEEVTTIITKTNEARHYVIRHRIKRNKDGAQEEIWQQGPYVVTHESTWKATQLAFETAREDTPTADFPELAWISAANFVDVQTVEGVPCLVFDATIIIGGAKPEFTRETAGGEKSGGEKGQIHEHACIDLETRLPRVLQNADILSHYTFQPPPTDTLVLPPADQEMINTYLKDTAARLRPPQHP